MVNDTAQQKLLAIRARFNSIRIRLSDKLYRILE
jgi:hypothetical protein